MAEGAIVQQLGKKILIIFQKQKFYLLWFNSDKKKK